MTTLYTDKKNILLCWHKIDLPPSNFSRSLLCRSSSRRVNDNLQLKKKKVLLKENLNLSVLKRISNPLRYKHFQLPSIPETLASNIPNSQLSNYPLSHTHKTQLSFHVWNWKAQVYLAKIQSQQEKHIPKSQEVKFSFHILKMKNWKNMIH